MKLKDDFDVLNSLEIKSRRFLFFQLTCKYKINLSFYFKLSKFKKITHYFVVVFFFKAEARIKNIFKTKKLKFINA